MLGLNSGHYWIDFDFGNFGKSSDGKFVLIDRDIGKRPVHFPNIYDIEAEGAPRDYVNIMINNEEKQLTNHHRILKDDIILYCLLKAVTITDFTESNDLFQRFMKVFMRLTVISIWQKHLLHCTLDEDQQDQLYGRKIILTPTVIAMINDINYENPISGITRETVQAAMPTIYYGGSTEIVASLKDAYLPSYDYYPETLGFIFNTYAYGDQRSIYSFHKLEDTPGWTFEI